MGRQRLFFASDLHGNKGNYQKLFQKITDDLPSGVFLGGDLFPFGGTSGLHPGGNGFLEDFLLEGFLKVKRKLKDRFPRVFLILGNDDPRIHEGAVMRAEKRHVWEYAHNRKIQFGEFTVFGYAAVPPTPFWLKDWEQYDVSRFLDPGAVAPEEGYHSTPFSVEEAPFDSTIQSELETLVGDTDLTSAIMLFHAPPYETRLDRAALDGKFVDHAPLDVHVGSIAIRRLIESRQPHITLHGHVHETVRLTGAWMDRLGRTFCFSAAHDGPELALVAFDPAHPESASRFLL